MPVDWKALLVGAVVAFSSFVIVGLVSEWMVALPIDALVDGATPDPGALSFLLVAAGVFPGALAAGYLHGLRLLEGMIYGIAAVIVGLVVPAVALIYLFAGLIGILSGELGVLLVVTLLLAFALPILIGEILVLGAVGGAAGVLLHRWRTA